MVAACGVVLAPLVARGSLRDDEQFLAVVGLAALIFPLLGVARLLPWAVALLAASVVVASEHGDLGSVGVALCAGTVLLVGECAAAAGHLAPLGRIERRLAVRLVLRIAAEAVVAGVLAAAVLASASLGIPSGLATFALGLFATVALLGLASVLVARR